MKIKGQSIPELKPKFAILLREPENIVLQCNPILDFSEFEKISPPPIGREIIKAGGLKSREEVSEEQTDEHATKRIGWMIVTSLVDNDIEWETVDVDDPDTFGNYEKELADSGITKAEAGHIVTKIFEASQIESDTLNELRDSFLVEHHLQHDQEKSQRTEPKST